MQSLKFNHSTNFYNISHFLVISTFSIISLTACGRNGDNTIDKEALVEKTEEASKIESLLHEKYGKDFDVLAIEIGHNIEGDKNAKVSARSLEDNLKFICYYDGVETITDSYGTLYLKDEIIGNIMNTLEPIADKYEALEFKGVYDYDITVANKVYKDNVFDMTIEELSEDLMKSGLQYVVVQNDTYESNEFTKQLGEFALEIPGSDYNRYLDINGNLIQDISEN